MSLQRKPRVCEYVKLPDADRMEFEGKSAEEQYSLLCEKLDLATTEESQDLYCRLFMEFNKYVRAWEQERECLREEFEYIEKTIDELSPNASSKRKRA